jgi:hypothetical protein
MPKITITEPFNYASGGVTTHYGKGAKDVPQAVADHAYKHGFATEPKEKAAKADAASDASAKA